MVVVVNASEAELTGRKWDQKLYRWHTGYPGGLKERTAKDQAARKPDAILRAAVLGMLPKNNLRRVRAGWGRGERWVRQVSRLRGVLRLDTVQQACLLRQ